ncbi:concanavalin A-like lectin/glucanase domain-containing protein [Artemisia annua]|uniref:Concanavalin A-like lectin/glucanase domain-containing protein n=1 Tax=Artemisia annua TaxID=35608 RepID=A0A2U1PEU7_ARTAN|nr:concanavalin A-like lectin/glucanase domain-containing protein [Artemisia annua]
MINRERMLDAWITCAFSSHVPLVSNIVTSYNAQSNARPFQPDAPLTKLSYSRSLSRKNSQRNGTPRALKIFSRPDIGTTNTCSRINRLLFVDHQRYEDLVEHYKRPHTNGGHFDDPIAETNYTCPGSQLNQVRYPFGFSSNCEIPLNCTSNGEILIGEFPIQEINDNNLLVSLPAKCGRAVNALSHLYSDHYAPTSNNAILMQNCTEQVKTCMIPATMLRTNLEIVNCSDGQGGYGNVSCYSSDGNHSAMFIDYGNVTRLGCRFLFSGVASEMIGDNSPAVSLDIQMVRLGWWLKGSCDCSNDADCTNIISPNGRDGYRCTCRNGFVGDGYKASSGCRIVKDHSGCNPSRYFSGHCGGTGRVGVLVGAIDRIKKNCLDEIIDPSLEPNKDAWTISSIHKVAEVAFKCLAFHSEMRPTMTEVAAELEQIRISGEENTTLSLDGSNYSSLSIVNENEMIKEVKNTESDKIGLFDSMNSTNDRNNLLNQDQWLSTSSSPSSNGLHGSSSRM